MRGRNHLHFLRSEIFRELFDERQNHRGPLQWSVGASLGIGYRFNGLVGIYLEPGVSYYFDNGSFVETVYRERPLNFSLGIGLRFNLN